MNKRMLANLALFMTALIWGLSFVAQRAGMEYVGPFTFNMVRSFLGGLSLLPLIIWGKWTLPDKRTKRAKFVQCFPPFSAVISGCARNPNTLVL